MASNPTQRSESNGISTKLPVVLSANGGFSDVDNAADSDSDGGVRGVDADSGDPGDTETLASRGGFISAAAAIVFNQVDLQPGRLTPQRRAINLDGIIG